jgi:hypothetical protein
VSMDKQSESEIKLLLNGEREGGVEYKLNQGKREDTAEGKYPSRSRLRKSSQYPNGTVEDINSRKNVEGGKGDDSFSKRDSKSSLRQSVLRTSGRNTYQEGEFSRGQFKLIDAEEAMLRAQGGSGGNSGRLGRFGLQRNSSGQRPDETVERSLKKKKSGRGRNNKYIKKNS